MHEKQTLLDYLSQHPSEPDTDAVHIEVLIDIRDILSALVKVLSHERAEGW